MIVAPYNDSFDIKLSRLMKKYNDSPIKAYYLFHCIGIILLKTIIKNFILYPTFTSHLSSINWKGIKENLMKLKKYHNESIIFSTKRLTKINASNIVCPFFNVRVSFV